MCLKKSHIYVFTSWIWHVLSRKKSSLFLSLSIIVKLSAKNDQKVVWSNSHIYVFTSWIWTCFDSFFESKFRICNMIFKIFSMCNHILVLDHFPDNSVFFKSCVVGGLKKGDININFFWRIFSIFALKWRKRGQKIFRGFAAEFFLKRGGY